LTVGKIRRCDIRSSPNSPKPPLSMALMAQAGKISKLLLTPVRFRSSIEYYLSTTLLQTFNHQVCFFLQMASLPSSATYTHPVKNRRVLVFVFLTRVWADAQPDGHPTEYRWHPLLKMTSSESSVIPFLVPRRKIWLTLTVRVPCSDAANI